MGLLLGANKIMHVNTGALHTANTHQILPFTSRHLFCKDPRENLSNLLNSKAITEFIFQSEEPVTLSGTC